MHWGLTGHQGMDPESGHHNPVVSMQQSEALQAVMDAANLQNLDGALWMHSSLLSDPSSLCKLGTLISAWACVYHADIRADAVRSAHVVVAHSLLETDYSSVRYQHWHDETL